MGYGALIGNERLLGEDIGRKRTADLTEGFENLTPDCIRITFT